MNPSEPCRVCGGDGRIHNSFGLENRCPACHGTGRRDDGSSGFRDVTKTKPAHFQQSNRAPVAEKRKDWPTSFEAVNLATEVRDNAVLTEQVKGTLIREIVDHEDSHGACTQTFVKKIRKQLRATEPAAPSKPKKH